MESSRRRFLASLPAASLAFSAVHLFSADAQENHPASSASAKSEPEYPELRFCDGQFNILQFTDLHLSFRDAGMDKAEKTLNVMRALIEREKPNLAIVTGDIIVCDPDDLSGGLTEAWGRFADVFNEYKLPFAITFGNHDHERAESAAKMLKMIQAHPFNCTRSDDESLPGAGNCVLPIKASDGSDEEKWRLWLFDSHSYPTKRDVGDYDWIKSEQIQWYRRTCTEKNAGRQAPLPAMAFFHIPLPEFWHVHASDKKIGIAKENVCSPELNSGLFTAFVEEGDVAAVFVGHDHVNDYIGVYKNIALAYGRQTGVDSYGDLPDGGRVISLNENNQSFRTCIVTPEESLFDYSSSFVPR